MPTLEWLEEYRRTHHYIPPKKLLAAYQGFHVSKIDPALVAKMDLRDAAELVLDADMRLCGVSYHGEYRKRGYIEISHDEYGEYLYKPERDADGDQILPDGWVDWDKQMDELYEDLQKEGLL